MKCEGCPVAQHVYGYMDNRVGNPKVHKWYPNDVCLRRKDDCSLTDTGKRILDAMLADEWKCAVCWWYEDCQARAALAHGNFVMLPCSDWSKDNPRAKENA